MGGAVQTGPSEANDRQIINDPQTGWPPTDEISFVDILSTLYQRRVLIAAITGVGVVLGLIMALGSPRMYVARTKVIPTAYLSSSSDASAMSALRGVTAQFGLGLGGPSANISPLFPQLLSSTELIGRILSKEYPLQNGRSIGLAKYLKVKQEDPEKALQVAVGSIRKKLISTYDMKSGVTTISASFRDPQLAAAVANAGAEELDHFLKELKTSQAGQKARFIAQRLDEVQTQLQQGEDALKIFREQNRQVLGSPLLMLEEARLARTVSMNEQVFITLKTQLETARIEAVRDVPDIAVIEKAAPPSPRSNRRRILMVATLLFGFAGIAIALSLPHIAEFRRVIKSREREERGSAPLV
jgi:tyrosine-protein kinase Etk/Wzc